MDKFPDASRRLTDIAGLKDDWNGYGAMAINQEVISEARTILNNLDVEPDIFPLPNGNIHFEWESEDGKRYMDTEFFPGGASVYRSIDEEDKVTTHVPCDDEYIALVNSTLHLLN